MGRRNRDFAGKIIILLIAVVFTLIFSALDVVGCPGSCTRCRVDGSGNPYHDHPGCGGCCCGGCFDNCVRGFEGIVTTTSLTGVNADCNGIKNWGCERYGGENTHWIVESEVWPGSETSCDSGKGVCDGAGDCKLFPIAYYKFDEYPQTHLRTVGDDSGNGNTGTFYTNEGQANKAANGVFGSALKFDGVDDYVHRQTNNFRISDNQGTISAWIKDSDSTTSAYRIFTSSSEDSSYDYFGFYVYQNKLKIQTMVGSIETRVSTSNSFPFNDGKWHYVVVMSDGSAWSLYVDGSLQSFVVEIGSNNGNWFADIASRENIGIGAMKRLGEVANFFKGSIDELKIYNRVLSPEEIQTEYESYFPDLIAYYKFNEGSGTTTVDSSEYHNDGTISGATSADSPIANGGKALSFDGVDDYVSIGDSVSLSSFPNGITIESWIYPKDLPLPDFHTIVDKSDNNNLRFHFNVKSDGALYYGFNNNYVTTQSSLIPLNSWHHIALVYDLSTVNSYVNGVLVNSAPFSGPIPDTARDLKIGTNLPMQTDEWFNGLIDELKIYNRALSASEIQAEYEANKLSDMLLNMTFDDGTAADSSEYHNDGTISGATSADSPIANGGKALSFDGANDWVSVGGDESQFDIAYKKLTVSAWIKADTNQPSPDGYYLIIDKSHGAVDNTGWFMQGDLSAGGTVSFGYGDGAVSWPGVPTSMSLLDNTWHHLVGVYNTTTLKIYVDGILDNSVPANSLPLDNDRPVDIGSHWGGGARQRYFKGEIDEIKIWSRALSADEINQEYETNKLISGEPDNSCDYCANNLSYWDINSGTDCSPMYSKNFTWENTIPAAQKYCCGDDSNEYYLTRDCTTGVCSSSGTDVVCCDNPTDCVYNNTCYAIGDTFDLTNDGDKEICSADGWIDGDSSEANCTYLSGNPRDTRWMTGAACGRGNCNDVNSDSPNFCCGDDLNESFREGENICYTSSEDCFFEGSYYADGSYEGDKYCQNGVLTSRTQLIATQLMDVAQQESPTDYVLFCDDFRSALNYVDYVIGEHTAANYFVGYDRWGSPEWVCGGVDKPCANKVCVLKLPDKVVFGASLNKPIEDDPLPFFSTLVGASDCTNGITNAANINDGQFHKCSGSFKLWYNNKTQSVIYSNSDIPIGAINFWDKFLLFLRDPFQKIFNFLVKLLITGNQGVVNVNQAGADYKFINSTSLYSRIYLARNNLKIVRGITEKVEYPKPGEHISVEYRCFADNIIHTVNAIDQRYMGSYVSGYGYSDRIFSIHNSSLGAYYVVSNSTNGLNLWPELTAKLRIKDTGNYPNTKVYPTIVNVPSSAVFGQEVKFEADIEGCNPPFAYSWNFGDGSVSTLSSPTHNYYPAAEQTYTVSLTVKDSSSPQDIGRATFNIRVLPGVKPVITPDLTNILVGQKTKLGVSDAFSDYTWSIVSGSEYCSISDISGDTKSINLTGNAVGETCKVKAESTQYPAYYDETETLHIVPLTGDLTCNVVPAVQCVESDSKKILFRMSALTNAHAQTTGSYGYAVCCELPGGTLNMGSGAEVISLSSTTNAHVAVDGRYANTIKISSQEKTFYCANATECMANESCVVSISSASNAHAATCNASQGDVYQKKICCGSGAVPTRRCFDDTEIGQCSVNKPQYCDAWQQLVDFCDENIGGCGCPAGEGCLSNGSCAITPQGCSDGTALDTCSANKPKYCNAQRELVDNCDMCGCTEGGVCLIDGTCDGAEQITTCDELLSIQSDGIYYLTNNIDCSSTPAFGPVADAFNGILDGNNFNITGPHIFRSGTGTVFFAGLFGYLGLNAYIVNLGIIDADVAASGTNGCSEVGILAGRNMGIIENTHVSGTITSSCYIVGGLVGSNDMGTILNSFSSAVVTAGSQIGGLVGSNGGWQEEQGTISESFSLGRILCSGQGLNDVGGLVGYIGGGSIENSFSHTTIDISCHSDIGGFVGYMGGGAVTKSYSTGLIESSLGNGFLGRTALGGAPSTYSYFDLQTSGQTSDAFALPKTTAEMKQQSTFVGWDFESIWAIDPDVNDGYPYLASTGSWT